MIHNEIDDSARALLEDIKKGQQAFEMQIKTQQNSFVCLLKSAMSPHSIAQLCI